jgi:hypothetical protein
MIYGSSVLGKGDLKTSFQDGPRDRCGSLEVPFRGNLPEDIEMDLMI